MKVTYHEFHEQQKERETFNRYINQIPMEIRPYIMDIFDVLFDGNCGCRATASALVDEDTWPLVRGVLDKELTQWKSTCAKVFGDNDVKEISERLSIDWKETFAPNERWMTMSDMGFLIASTYKVVVIFLSLKGSSTLFPLRGWVSPTCHSSTMVKELL